MTYFKNLIFTLTDDSEEQEEGNTERKAGKGNKGNNHIL